MEPLHILFIALGGLVAGILNVAAGGGSMITVPLLIFSGLPPTVANGTNRVAIALQNVGALSGFRRHGLTPGRRSVRLLIPTVLGAAAGAAFATDIDETTMRRAIGLILVVMLIPLLRRRPKPAADGPVDPPRGLRYWPLYFVVGAYGGFIQIGVGFFYLTLFVGMLGMDLVRANVLKVFFVLVYTCLALVLFAVNGQVDWAAGLVLAAGQTAGGWLGARLAVTRGESWIRAILIVAVLASAIQLTGLGSWFAGLLRGEPGP